MKRNSALKSQGMAPAVEMVPINALRPHPDNPRTHSKQQVRQIADSIRTFGFRIPVLVDRDNRIICGHGRVEACRQLGQAEVPVLRADDLSESQVRALMIADNRLTDLSGWDEVVLGQNFEVLLDSELDFDLEVTGFEYGGIEALIDVSGNAPDHDQDPGDELPEQEAVPAVCQPGDLWQLGRHRILCGDATLAESYTLLMDGNRASIVFTDPPYNLPAKAIGKVCARKHGDFAFAAGEMSPEGFTDFLSTVFGHLCTSSADGSIHYICMDWRHLPEILTAGRQQYSELKNLCVWVKDRAGMGTFYRSQHELVLVFKNGAAPHQNHFKLGQHGRHRSNVWSYPSVRSMQAANGDAACVDALAMHPTIKPVAMIENALRDCSRKGELVLDAFLGSGSTLIAAERIGRICYGIELDPRYVDVAITRWQQWSGEAAIHVASGKSFDVLRADQEEFSDAEE